jgi:hypothetical protein
LSFLSIFTKKKHNLFSIAKKFVAIQPKNIFLKFFKLNLALYNNFILSNSNTTLNIVLKSAHKSVKLSEIIIYNKKGKLKVSAFFFPELVTKCGASCLGYF